jgi:GT2 family glycosyltransferase
MRKPKILISILNWNGARKTLKCVESLKDEAALPDADVTMLVIDNGSRQEDVAQLVPAAEGGGFLLKRLPENLGFTGGHNVSIEIAIEEGYDYIWLMNNDATVVPGALRELVSIMENDNRCGVVSPVLRDADDHETIARCVNIHDWSNRTYQRIVSIPEARKVQAENPASVWLDGTATLIRIEALKETGPLDDRLFAYYDDNDIGARMTARGWYNRCAFDASVIHENRKSIAEYPLYLSYLLQRNEMLFWYTNTPPAYRRLLWLKLVDKALFEANRLYLKGFPAHGDAALIGLYDFLRGKFGPPAYDRNVPFFLKVACKLSARFNAKKLLPVFSQEAPREA